MLQLIRKVMGHTFRFLQQNQWNSQSVSHTTVLYLLVVFLTLPHPFSLLSPLPLHPPSLPLLSLIPSPTLPLLPYPPLLSLIPSPSLSFLILLSLVPPPSLPHPTTHLSFLFVTMYRLVQSFAALMSEGPLNRDSVKVISSKKIPPQAKFPSKPHAHLSNFSAHAQ